MVGLQVSKSESVGYDGKAPVGLFHQLVIDTGKWRHVKLALELDDHSVGTAGMFNVMIYSNFSFWFDWNYSNPEIWSCNGNWQSGSDYCIWRKWVNVFKWCFPNPDCRRWRRLKVVVFYMNRKSSKLFSSSFLSLLDMFRRDELIKIENVIKKIEKEENKRIEGIYQARCKISWYLQEP